MNHAAMDETADYAARHITPSDLHKARYCSGACNQGREACNCPTGAGEACSELLEDQSDSADRDVVMFLLKLIAGLVAFNAVAYYVITYVKS